MTTETTIPTVEEDVKVVTEAFLAGRPVPSDVDTRIAERAAKARERIFEEQGDLNIAVPYIRASRETGH